VTHVFVVPGDYNLPLLDGLAQVPGLTLVNTANELNAAYAAGACTPPRRRTRPPPIPAPWPRLQGCVLRPPPPAGPPARSQLARFAA
jgi:hypothetical protein